MLARVATDCRLHQVSEDHSVRRSYVKELMLRFLYAEDDKVDPDLQQLAKQGHKRAQSGRRRPVAKHHGPSVYQSLCVPAPPCSAPTATVQPSGAPACRLHQLPTRTDKAQAGSSGRFCDPHHVSGTPATGRLRHDHRRRRLRGHGPHFRWPPCPHPCWHRRQHLPHGRGPRGSKKVATTATERIRGAWGFTLFQLRAKEFTIPSEGVPDSTVTDDDRAAAIGDNRRISAQSGGIFSPQLIEGCAAVLGYAKAGGWSGAVPLQHVRVPTQQSALSKFDPETTAPTTTEPGHVSLLTRRASRTQEAQTTSRTEHYPWTHASEWDSASFAQVQLDVDLPGAGTPKPTTSSACSRAHKTTW